MSKLFPIGEITVATSLGTINSISYGLFEPNMRSSSSITYTNLVSTFQNQFRQTRKKADPFLSISYEYENIFTREYRQIENFIDSVGGTLNSFLCIDWSKGITPTNVSSGWVVSVSDTTLYSIYAGKKAYRGLLWDGVKWKLGTVSAISANTSITLSTSEGALTYENASSSGILYPVYDVYIGQAQDSKFKVTNYLPLEAVNLSDDGGSMYSGKLTFIGKYKV